MAYRKPEWANNSGLESVERYVGETIEEKVERVVNNGDPIEDGAPRIYTERKDGVGAQYDIRTDRWEIAVDAMDAVVGSYKAKREQRGISREDIVKNEPKADENLGKASGDGE
jgi:hypothetical protein